MCLIECLPFLCSRRSGGFWLLVVVVLLVGLGAAAPVWLLCPTIVGGAGAAEAGACTACSRVGPFVKESSWGPALSVNGKANQKLRYSLFKEMSSWNLTLNTCHDYSQRHGCVLFKWSGNQVEMFVANEHRLKPAQQFTLGRSRWWYIDIEILATLSLWFILYMHAVSLYCMNWLFPYDNTPYLLL